jgi:hypothetical protein
MFIAASDDSYCTTDDGGEEKENYDREGNFMNADNNNEIDISENKYAVGNSIPIINNKFFKKLIKLGNNSEVGEIDDVKVDIKCYFNDCIVESFNFIGDYSLEENNFPKGVKLALKTMKENEICEIMIPFKYLLKYASKHMIDEIVICDKSLEGTKLNKKLIEFDENDMFLFIINVISINKCMYLDSKKLVKKKTIKEGLIGFTPKQCDMISFNLKCYADEFLLYNKDISEKHLDDLYDEKLVNKEIMERIELMLIKNVKLQEKCEIYVQPDYIKNVDGLNFFSKFPIAKDKLITYYIEVLDLKKFNYIYKNTSRYGKNNRKHVLQNGIRQDYPDRESFVKLKLLLKIDGKIVFNSFTNKVEDDFNLINFRNDEDSLVYKDYREKMNEKYNYTDEDKEDNFIVNKEIFEGFDLSQVKSNNCFNKNHFDFDMKSYDLPISLRKVLVHMKRNEIVYFTTDFIDYMQVGDFIIQDIKSDVNKNVKIEFVVHLFEFLHRKIFSNLDFSDKLDFLKNCKEQATLAFKQNRFFKALKIFHNVYFRFHYGDVFGNSSKIKTDNLKENSPDLYNEILNIKISSYTNLSNISLKLGKYDKCVQIIDELLEDEMNNLDEERIIKLLYIKGFALGNNINNIESLNNAKKTLERLLGLKDNHKCFEEVKDKLKEIISNITIIENKQKNLFKKMIFKSDN